MSSLVDGRDDTQLSVLTIAQQGNSLVHFLFNRLSISQHPKSFPAPANGLSYRQERQAYGATAGSMVDRIGLFEYLCDTKR